MNTMAPEAVITADTAWIDPALCVGAVRLVRAMDNDEVYVSGREAKYHVRAALAPEWNDPDALTTLVQAIAHGYADDDLRWMTRANRIRVAVAAMRGWAEHHEYDHPPLVWVRHMNGRRLWVTEVVARVELMGLYGLADDLRIEFRAPDATSEPRP